MALTARRFDLFTSCILGLLTLVGGEHTLAAPPELETASGALASGNVDMDAVAVVAIGRIDDGVYGFRCSGTLIAPNVVLTARHCVGEVLVDKEDADAIACNPDFFGDSYEANRFTVNMRARFSYDPDDARTTSVAAVVVPADVGRYRDDIALLVLNEPVEPSVATPLSVRVDEPVVNGVPCDVNECPTYTAIGYGALDADGDEVGLRRRLDDLAIECGDSECDDTCNGRLWVGDDGSCPGDSGGPALDNLGRVIGVMSGGGENCTRGIYVSVYQWADWLSEQVAEATRAAGLEPPPWAVGQPSDAKAPGDDSVLGELPDTLQEADGWTQRALEGGCDGSGSRGGWWWLVAGGVALGMQQRRQGGLSA